MNKIPGADYLGCGFNINGKFDSSSATFQLFQQTYSKNQTHQDQNTHIDYLVPDNVALYENTQAQGDIHVFQTKQEFQSFFSGKAGLKVSDGLFSGEFDTAYSQTLNTSNSYYYCLCENEYSAWKLGLQDESFRVLSETFTEDPGIKNLPNTFNDQNQEQFFEVFRKFGTHFISQVVLGGSMRYYVAVDKSYSSKSQDISANLTLEYNALFFKTEIEAQADWKTIDQAWTQNRFAQVQSKGGNDSMLNILSPQRDVSYKNVYDQWLKSLMSNPCIITFQLRPLSQLFSSDKIAAVDKAIETYNSSVIVASASMEWKGPQPLPLNSSPCISKNGNNIDSNPPVQTPAYKQVDIPILPFNNTYKKTTEPLGGFQIALFDRYTYNVLFSRIYYVDQTDPNDYPPLAETTTQVYKDMMKDISTITDENYICAVAGFGIDLHNLPSVEFSNWLKSCGARWEEWQKEQKIELDFGRAERWVKICYTCIGVKGNQNNAIEDYASCDWADNTMKKSPSSTYFLYCQEANTNAVKALRIAAGSPGLPQ